MTWGAGCPYPVRLQLRDTVSTLTSTHRQGTQAYDGQQKTPENNGTCGTKDEGTVGT